MSVKIINEDNKVIALLSGEIDHHNAKSLRQDIDFSLRENQPEELIMDFSEVGFMDSSGIGLVMGRYKLMQEIGGNLVVRNPPPHIKKVMRLSGIDRLASICNV
ncbi:MULTISPECIES: STAS domain-containing protein [Porcipelethomonas]|jgi:stage II sporulation protein AA (anti-sigma F factor antagonist)|uniref:STAS domain-containing protein n=1 Tax=Porcipelethomonas TaxID=2981643 RepID=UPI000822D72E|nr:STAS domain-containing protein [Porcipelethomonas ammoniilytica]MBS1324470.1 STAS domain-containing protein [Oscillospiraceae bacterium]MBS6314376.1 STAS domain-containing protein [Ruminococcus sp.]OLA69314.1 MAG: anti-anti-sigma factor [Ruminococcus sp. 37_24]SCI60528.1 Stage II sporulation protein AA [uncultured Ruminococcus sp.]MCU6718783.1 STAS domain-containing protein [Porcipelethomonas ammoniilytica]